MRTQGSILALIFYAISGLGLGCGDDVEPGLRVSWTYDAQFTVAEPAAGPEDRVIVMLSEKSDQGMGRLVTLDAITGLALEGPFDVVTLTDHAPRVRGTEIFAVSKIGKIEKYNLIGESLGSFPDQHMGVTSPISFAPDGSIRIASTNGKLYSFDPADGNLNFEATIDQGVDSPLAIGDDSSTYLASPLGRVEGVDANGAKKFTVSTGALASGASVSADGVYVGHASGVDKFDLTGSKVFSHQRGANVLGTRISASGDILTWGQDGVFEVLSSSGDTKLRYRTRPESEPNPPTIPIGPASVDAKHYLVADDQGEVYLVNNEGAQLASLTLEGVPRAKSNIIMSEKGTAVVSVGSKIIGLRVILPSE